MEAKDQGIQATYNNLYCFEKTFEGNIQMHNLIKIRLISKALVTQGMIARQLYFNQYLIHYLHPLGSINIQSTSNLIAQALSNF